MRTTACLLLVLTAGCSPPGPSTGGIRPTVIRGRHVIIRAVPRIRQLPDGSERLMPPQVDESDIPIRWDMRFTPTLKPFGGVLRPADRGVNSAGQPLTAVIRWSDENGNPCWVPVYDCGRPTTIRRRALYGRWPR